MIPAADKKDLFLANNTVIELKSRGAEFAVATVVRTVSVTAAKPGAKAIIDAQGDIIEGWIGGGCVKSAVVKAAVTAMRTGEPKLVSVQPKALLAEQGIMPGEDVDGVLNASNLCPSEGTMDVFIEPILSDPELLILGTSPVAYTLAALSQSFEFNVRCASSNPEVWSQRGIEAVSYENTDKDNKRRYIVIATQGSGDAQALQIALSLKSNFIGFVGSSRKTKHLQMKLQSEGFSEEQTNVIKGPAGLDIGAVTPHEIALSILAEIVSLHRRKRLPVLAT